MPIKKYDDLQPKRRKGHLTLLEVIYKEDAHRIRKYWKCKCVKCKRIFIAREDLIKSGQQISCGCMGKAYRHLWLLRHKSSKQ